MEFDEISLTNDTKVITNEGEKDHDAPIELGKRIVSAEDIYGGNTPEKAHWNFKRNHKEPEATWAPRMPNCARQCCYGIKLYRSVP